MNVGNYSDFIHNLRDTPDELAFFTEVGKHPKFMKKMVGDYVEFESKSWYKVAVVADRILCPIGADHASTLLNHYPVVNDKYRYYNSPMCAEALKWKKIFSFTKLKSFGVEEKDITKIFMRVNSNGGGGLQEYQITRALTEIAPPYRAEFLDFICDESIFIPERPDKIPGYLGFMSELDQELLSETLPALKKLVKELSPRDEKVKITWVLELMYDLIPKEFSEGNLHPKLVLENYLSFMSAMLRAQGSDRDPAFTHNIRGYLKFLKLKKSVFYLEAMTSILSTKEFYRWDILSVPLLELYSTFPKESYDKLTTLFDPSRVTTNRKWGRLNMFGKEFKDQVLEILAKIPVENRSSELVEILAESVMGKDASVSGLKQAIAWTASASPPFDSKEIFSLLFVLNSTRLGSTSNSFKELGEDPILWATELSAIYANISHNSQEETLEFFEKYIDLFLREIKGKTLEGEVVFPGMFDIFDYYRLLPREMRTGTLLGLDRVESGFKFLLTLRKKMNSEESEKLHSHLMGLLEQFLANPTKEDLPPFLVALAENIVRMTDQLFPSFPSIVGEPLFELALHVSILSSRAGELRNPIRIQKELVKAKAFPQVELPPLDLYGEQVSINLAGLRAATPKAFTRAELPIGVEESDYRTMFQALKDRIDQLSPEDQEAARSEIVGSTELTLDQLEANLFDKPTIPGLLKLPQDLGSTLSPYTVYLYRIIAHIKAISNEIPEGSLLSQREDALVKSSVSISNCSTGQRDGISTFHALLPNAPEDSIGSSKPDAELELVANGLFQAAMEKTFKDDAFVGEITGTANHNQMSHQTLFLKNRLFKAIGFQHQLSFDSGTYTLYEQLLQASDETLLRAFFNHFPLEEVVGQFQQKVSEAILSGGLGWAEIERHLSAFLPPIPDYDPKVVGDLARFEAESEARLEALKPLISFKGEDPTDYEFELTGVTQKGALTLLKSLHYINISEPPSQGD